VRDGRFVCCDIGHELAAYRGDELIRVRPAYDAPDDSERPERRRWRHPWRGGRVEPSLPVEDDLRARIGGYLESVVPQITH
jgi:hypothetical protein